MDANETATEQSTTANGPLMGGLRKLGLKPGQVVIEFGYDEDVEEDLRVAAETLTEGPLEDEDYDGVVDVVLLWWRDGDGDLTDELVDAMSTLDDGGSIVLLTPGAGREDRVAAPDIQDACDTCSFSASGGVPLGGWLGQRLVGRR